MVTCEWLEEEIRGVVPDCDVEAIDLNGTQDHFHIRIIAESFQWNEAIAAPKADFEPLQTLHP